MGTGIWDGVLAFEEVGVLGFVKRDEILILVLVGLVGEVLGFGDLGLFGDENKDDNFSFGAFLDEDDEAAMAEEE